MLGRKVVCLSNDAGVTSVTNTLGAGEPLVVPEAQPPLSENPRVKRLLTSSNGATSATDVAITLELPSVAGIPPVVVTPTVLPSGATEYIVSLGPAGVKADVAVADVGSSITSYAVAVWDETWPYLFAPRTLGDSMRQIVQIGAYFYRVDAFVGDTLTLTPHPSLNVTGVATTILAGSQVWPMRPESTVVSSGVPYNSAGLYTYAFNSNPADQPGLFTPDIEAHLGIHLRVDDGCWTYATMSSPVNEVASVGKTYDFMTVSSETAAATGKVSIQLNAANSLIFEGGTQQLQVIAEPKSVPPGGVTDPMALLTLIRFVWSARMLSDGAGTNEFGWRLSTLYNGTDFVATFAGESIFGVNTSTTPT